MKIKNIKTKNRQVNSDNKINLEKRNLKIVLSDTKIKKVNFIKKIAITNLCLVFYFLFNFVIISITSKRNDNNKRKLTSEQSIVLKVLEAGEQEIIWSQFVPMPSIEYINEENQPIPLTSSNKYSK